MDSNRQSVAMEEDALLIIDPEKVVLGKRGEKPASPPGFTLGVGGGTNQDWSHKGHIN